MEQCPEYNNSHRDFVERCPDDNNIYNNSHRGFVERCPQDNNIITISTEVLWDGVQITIIDITIPTDVLGMMSR